MAAHLIDEAGRNYGALLVLSHVETARNGGRWQCWCCACSTLCVVLGSSLRAGRTRSCGCWARACQRARAAARNLARKATP
jgi:hypothetical protein